MPKAALLIGYAVTLCSGVAIGVFLGNPKSQPTPPSLTAAPSEASQPSSDTRLVKRLLTERLDKRAFAFSDVIFSSSGKVVIPFNSSNKHHRELKTIVEKASRLAIEELNKAHSPIKKLRRINEASGYFENSIRENINFHPDFQCSIPKNVKGKEQRSGYPDLLITHLPSQTRAYLDPKLFENRSRSSTLRTFYYEPKSHTLKIQHDALHLLIGIEHDGEDGNWTFGNAHIVDTSDLKVKLKAEFHASNKDLYNESLILE